MVLDLGKRIKFLRKKKKLSIEDLAAKSGISKSTIGRIEKNEYSPNINNLLPICDALQVNLTTLFTEEEDEYTADINEFTNLAKKLTKNEREKVKEMLKAFIDEKENLKK